MKNKFYLLFADPFDFCDTDEIENLGLIGIKMVEGLDTNQPIRIIDDWEKEIKDFITTTSGCIICFALKPEQYLFLKSKSAFMEKSHAMIIKSKSCDCGNPSCLLRNYEKWWARYKFYQNDKELIWQFTQ